MSVLMLSMSIAERDLEARHQAFGAHAHQRETLEDEDGLNQWKRMALQDDVQAAFSSFRSIVRVYP
jgi:hypothetical protein